MRFHFISIGLLLAASLNGQDYLQNYLTDTTRTDSEGTEILDAPRFGTPDYFKTHFALSKPIPQFELTGPVRLADFVVDGHIELSLADFIELVMANNTEIQIQRLSMESPKNAITRALATFDPRIDLSFQATRSTTPTTSTLDSGRDISSSLRQPFGATYTQTFDTGTSYNLRFNSSRSTSNSLYSTLNPSFSSGLTLNVTQPLIRNFGRNINRISIMTAQSRLRVSRNSFEDQLLRLLASAETAYWSVVDARENLTVNQNALDLAQKTLDRSERELELGAISELDIYQPQQNHARQQILVTTSQFSLEQAYDALRRQIGADLDPQYRNMPIRLTEPVLPPEGEEKIDAEAMVELALRRRPDIRTLDENLYQADLSFRSARNGLRPDLSLGMNYASNGVGGTIIEYEAGEVVNTIPGGFWDSVNQLRTFNYPTYGFSLTLRLPIRDRSAVASMADALVSKKTTELQARNTRQTVRLDVLNAVSSVEGAKQRVAQAQISLEFAQKRLDGEQLKYDLGVTDIFFLLDAQNALSNAQAELVTQAAQYRRSMVTLLRVTGQLLEDRGIVVQ